MPTECPPEDTHAAEGSRQSAAEVGPPLTHLVLAQWREHSGHSGRMGPFRGSAVGLSPTKPPLLPSFLDLQPADERGSRSAPVGPHSPGAGCGNRPAAWGWADVPGTPSVTEGGGRAPRSGCGLAAPTSAARAGFHSSRASQQHDLPPKSSFVTGVPRGLSVWSLHLPLPDLGGRGGDDCTVRLICSKGQWEVGCCFAVGAGSRGTCSGTQRFPGEPLLTHPTRPGDADVTHPETVAGVTLSQGSCSL